MLSWNASAGRQGASAVIYIRGCDDITKRDVSGWRGNTREGTRKKMMLKSLHESRKSGNGRKMTVSTISFNSFKYCSNSSSDAFIFCIYSFAIQLKYNYLHLSR